MPQIQELPSYPAFESRMAIWATRNRDIRALVVYGSRAQQDSDPDEFSDLDLILFTIDRERYGGNSQWIRDIGDPWLATLDQTGAGDPEWFVLFEGGIKVDIILSEVTQDVSLEDLLAASLYRDAIGRGYRVLCDNAQPAMIQRRQANEKSNLVSSDAFELKKQADRVLMKIVKASMLFSRGDLAGADSHMVSGVRPSLLALQEMQATVAKDAGLRTVDSAVDLDRMIFIEDKSTSSILDSHPETTMVQNELNASIDLTLSMAYEIANTIGFPFPDTGQNKAIVWLRSLINR